jgi:membrane-bound lytic murein transglycosylase B
MSQHAKPRRSTHLGAVVALGMFPVFLTTSQAAQEPSPEPRPRAQVLAATSGSYATPDLAPPTSRSSSRFDLLELTAGVAAYDVSAGKGNARRKVRVSGPKGTRMWSASAMSDHNVPAAAVRAYRTAARTMASVDPSCQLPWTLLAGIGKVESDHGRYGGATLGRDGVSHPLIIGIALNGVGPVAAIRDSDNGRLDKDKVWDRAVGPMQFIPTTWADAARDGDGDGTRTPNDIDDAALAAAGYLCSGSGSVLGEAAMGAAVYRYNQDDYYVALVLSLERGYRTGVFVIPSPPVPAEDETTDPRRKKKHHKADRGHAGAKPRGQRPAGSKDGGSAEDKPKTKPSTKPSTKPASKPPPKSSSEPSPKPSPQPSPSPEPTGPLLSTLSGSIHECSASSGWCLDDIPLDLGPVVFGEVAADDFDGDQATESNAEELKGLIAGGTTLTVEQKASGVAVVYLINGKDYRLGDGSLA